jgi:AbrB family looped-hinge helix DNA binding protein
MIEAKVTSKGQVTLPIELRERLGIIPGDRLVFVEQPDGSFTLRVRSGTLADLRGFLGDETSAAPGDETVRGWIDEARGRALGRETKAR